MHRALCSVGPCPPSSSAGKEGKRRGHVVVIGAGRSASRLACISPATRWGGGPCAPALAACGCVWEGVCGAWRGVPAGPSAAACTRAPGCALHQAAGLARTTGKNGPLAASADALNATWQARFATCLHPAAQRRTEGTLVVTALPEARMITALHGLPTTCGLAQPSGVGHEKRPVTRPQRATF